MQWQTELRLTPRESNPTNTLSRLIPHPHFKKIAVGIMQFQAESERERQKGGGGERERGRERLYLLFTSA